MMIIYIIYLIIMMMLLLMMMLYLILYKKINKNRMKMSPFESGFEPLSKMRLPFSIQFYLISIIFLIFDVEIALILPMIKTFNFNYWFMNYNFIMIMFILMIGLLIEWKEGAFYWFK